MKHSNSKRILIEILRSLNPSTLIFKCICWELSENQAACLESDSSLRHRFSWDRFSPPRGKEDRHSTNSCLQNSEVFSLFTKYSCKMNITGFALWMHLLVFLLRMCYQESGQTKASDMEGSGHWDCAVFSCIHRKHISPLSSPLWVGSVPVSTRCVENGHSISQPRHSLGAVAVRPCLPSLHRP